MQHFHQLLLLLSLLLALPAAAQRYVVEGCLTDAAGGYALPGAAAELLRADSSIVASAQTDSTGAYALRSDAPGRYVVRFVAAGYRTELRDVRLNDRARRQQLRVSLHAVGHTLREAVVQGTRMLFVTKKDTVVYNLDAVMAEAGATLGEALERLPGLEVKEGKLYFKGKAVERLLINGDDFISGDASLMLSNLPAYVVKNVKAYERKSDQTRITGVDDGTRQQVVDVIIKRAYMGTWTANADAGYGSDNYYLGRLFGNTFNDQWRLSLFGSLTNTGVYQSAGSDGNWSDNGQSSGETTYGRPGFSFQYKNKKAENEAGYFKIQANARYDLRRHNDHGSSEAETFLDQGSTFSASDYHTRDLEQVTAGGLSINWRPTAKTYVDFSPYFTYSRRSNRQTSRSGQWNADPFARSAAPLDSLFEAGGAGWPEGQAVTATRGRSKQVGNSMSYSHSLWATQDLHKKGWYLQLRHNFWRSGADARTHELNGYHYYATTAADQPDLINRYRNNSNWSYNAGSFLDFCAPLLAHGRLRLSYGYTANRSHTDNVGYRLDSLGGPYADFDHYAAHLGLLPPQDSLPMVREAASTLYRATRSQAHCAELWLQRSYRGLYTHVQVTYRRVLEHMDYRRGRMSTLPLGRHYSLFFTSLQLRYEADSIGNFSLYYSLDPNMPDLLSLVDIPDTEDPLRISLGNPHLRRGQNHSAGISYDRTLKELRTVGIDWYVNATTNAVVSTLRYDRATGVTTTRPVNVNGNWSTGGGGNFNTPLGEQKRWNLYLALRYAYNRSINFAMVEGTDAQRTPVYNHWWGPSLSLSYRSGTFFGRLSVNGSYNRLKSSLASANDAAAYRIGYVVDLRYGLPLGFDVATRCNVSHRAGTNAAGFKKWRTIWSASLSKSFLKEKNLVVKVEGVDLLNQRDMSGYSVSPTARSRYFVNNVQRYVMGHLIYRFTFKPSAKT